MQNLFLTALLGEAGAAAVQHLSKMLPVERFLVPRAALAWLHTLEGSWEGAVPGTGVPLTLAKTEDGWTGAVVLDGTSYGFVGASPAHVAAALTLAVGGRTDRPHLKGLDLARVGRTVDLLVKAKKAGESAHGTGVAAGRIPPVPRTPVEDYKERGQNLLPGEKKPLGAKKDKQEAAAPEAAAEGAPAGAGAAKPKLPRLPKAKGPRPLRLSVSDTSSACQVCGQKNFEGVVLKGCFCLQDLVKKVRDVEVVGTNLVLTFAGDIEPDEYLTLLETLKP